MPSARLVRRNAEYLPWVRALSFAAVAAAALAAMPFYPPYVVAILALVVGALAFTAPSPAALLLVGVVSLPILAANFVVGVLFLIVGFSATQYLGADNARGFLVIAAAALAVAFHAEWAIAVLAGYLMGAGPGAIATLLACLLIQVAGALLGLPHVGSVFIGGAGPGVLDFTRAPAAPLAFRWLAGAIAAAEPSQVIAAVVRVKPVAILVVQPLAWGLGAVLGSIFRRPHTGTERLTASAGLAGVTLILAAANALVLPTLGGNASLPTLGLTALVSAVVAALIGLVTENVFGLERSRDTSAPATSSLPYGVRAEDADVDELLRLIASAEDELTSRHTTDKVVMLTDIRAFSAMTEVVGSIASAKLVQRQRDLLLPVIDRHRGHGKSTGGDGLVAAFDDAGDAVDAAVEMQRELTAYGEAGPGGERMAIRIGIARGEVVLDKNGRPFIGAALNLAARVMEIADGGTIVTTSELADAARVAPGDRVDLGPRDLKNIQMPVSVTEVRW